jgi:acetolactate decarboxylase
MQGVFDGILPIGELKKHGDFGIGTFDALEGEMIVLDGKVYHAKADGRVYSVMDNTSTPLATVTYFNSDFSETPPGHDFSVFSSEMSARLPSQNMIYDTDAWHIPQMKVQAIPGTTKPYPPLMREPVSLHTPIPRFVVGHRPFSRDSMSGYHLHFSVMTGM